VLAVDSFALTSLSISDNLERILTFLASTIEELLILSSALSTFVRILLSLSSVEDSSALPTLLFSFSVKELSPDLSEEPTQDLSFEESADELPDFSTPLSEVQLHDLSLEESTLLHHPLHHDTESRLLEELELSGELLDE
jgi:hypothetical protein